MSPDKLQELAKTVQERGPTRVLVDAHGSADIPDRARQKGHYPVIIFLRDDHWSLAAPRQLITAAYHLWPGEWVGVLIRGCKKAIPIKEWLDADRPEHGTKYLSWKLKQKGNMRRVNREW